MTIDEKDLYWAKELNKHDHKIFEVEVINTIKLKLIEVLGNKFWNLKPSFQSYVLRDGGKRALIDFTFDALNVGLEVDEGHHNNQKEADAKREIDIFEAMASCGRTNFEIRRVDVTHGYEKKKHDINEFCELVKARVKENPVLKWDDEPGYVKYKVGDSIKFKDMFEFVTKSDLFNTLLHTTKWGKAKPGQKSKVEQIYEKFGLTCTKCSIQSTNPEKELSKLYPNQKFYIRRKDGWNLKGDANEVKNLSRVWYNKYSPDFKTIDMYTNEVDYSAEVGNKNEIQHIFIDKNGFVVYVGSYKVKGIYKTDECFDYRKKNVKMNCFIRLERIDDKIKIK